MLLQSGYFRNQTVGKRRALGTDDYFTVLLFDVSLGLWSVEVNIPDEDVHYRYFVASLDPSHLCGDSSVHVRRFETHMKTRVILKGNEPQAPNDIETFGVVDGIEKVDKGWLTNETVLEFKFFNNPFNLKERVKNRLLYVKVTMTNCDSKRHLFLPKSASS